MRRQWWFAMLAVLMAGVTLYAATISEVPTSIGTQGDAWTNVGGADKIASVATNDGDTSYIESGTLSQNQWFVRPTLTFSASSINSVQVQNYCKEVVSAEVQSRIRVNGTNYSNASQGCPSSASYQLVTSTWATNPNTTAAWTEADVKGTGAAPLQEFGYQANQVGVGDEVRITQALLTVDYNAAATGLKRLLMLGVGEFARATGFGFERRTLTVRLR